MRQGTAPGIAAEQRPQVIIGQNSLLDVLEHNPRAFNIGRHDDNLIALIDAHQCAVHCIAKHNGRNRHGFRAAFACEPDTFTALECCPHRIPLPGQPAFLQPSASRRALGQQRLATERHEPFGLLAIIVQHSHQILGAGGVHSVRVRCADGVGEYHGASRFPGACRRFLRRCGCRGGHLAFAQGQLYRRLVQRCCVTHQDGAGRVLFPVRHDNAVPLQGGLGFAHGFQVRQIRFHQPRFLRHPIAVVTQVLDQAAPFGLVSLGQRLRQRRKRFGSFRRIRFIFLRFRFSRGHWVWLRGPSFLSG